MKPKFRLFRRGNFFWSEDTKTRKQESLKTRDRNEAVTILNARNEAHREPSLNLQIARAYLGAGDPAARTRTWQEVMDAMAKTEGWRNAQAMGFAMKGQRAIVSSRGLAREANSCRWHNCGGGAKTRSLKRCRSSQSVSMMTRSRISSRRGSNVGC